MSIVNISEYRKNATMLTDDLKLVDAYFTVFRQNKDNPGACHLSSATLYVLLQELGYDAKLCLGEVEYGPICFDHSWVEVEGKVYDSAIAIGLEGRHVTEPIFCDHYLDSSLGKIDGIIHGVQTPSVPDEPTKFIIKRGFSHYMTAAPFRHGVWSIVKKAGKEIGLRLDIEDLKKKYQDHQWNIKTPYKI